MRELRDRDAATQYILQGLWLQRATKPTAPTVKPALEWAMAIASAGHPLPPLGVVADMGHVALGLDFEQRPHEVVPVVGWPPALSRGYEDQILGKLYADWTFERASNALRRYSGTDRIRGLAYIINQIRERAALPGVLLSPAVIRAQLNSLPEEVLRAGWDLLEREGPLPLLIEMYTAINAAGRRIVELLDKADILALEQGTALADMGQYVAHRQILQATAKFLAWLPNRPVKPLVGRQEVPTRIHDDDQYPVGGYTSIATRGSIESLLHSQLAYMERESPDLFDIKFVRDELFYYSRDENQFLRRRRAFVFVLFPDLYTTRLGKDLELPYQRIVLVQSLIVALIEKLTEWLSNDAIRFDVLFVQEGEKNPLAEEAKLLRILLRETIERGDGAVCEVPDKAAAIAHLKKLARTAQVHTLAIATEPFEMAIEHVGVTEVIVSGPRPAIGAGDGMVAELDGDEAFEVWQETALRVLQLWV
ncbi:MAG: hypothetical protein RMJ56_04995 [Gemmataceae bacterium]|nr:hypothetical protein [Gemmata sp.]MDW8196947.1 hypothetical protein [Gemmataceae bacterium]